MGEKINQYVLGIFLLILDQVSKFWITDKVINIIPHVLNFCYTRNEGAAFGISNTNTVLPVSIVIIIATFIFIVIQYKQSTNSLPFVLILSGSLGNLIDRIFRGYVIDFIDIKGLNFPVFNIADICIVIGFIYLIYTVIFKMNSKKYEKKNM